MPEGLMGSSQAVFLVFSSQVFEDGVGRLDGMGDLGISGGGLG